MNIKVQVLPSELKLKNESFNFYELTPIQKLDAVLDSLELYSEQINNIQRILRLKLEPATLYEVRAIINKLMKDGYAEEIKAKLPQPAFYDSNNLEAGYIISYKITFEGMYLKSSGGYQGLQNQKDAENIRLEKIERKVMANQRFLTWLTVIVAVSAAATVVYYAVELYWRYGWFH
jgi:hypothetical protein